VEALQHARLSEVLDLGDALRAEFYDLDGKTRRLELGWRDGFLPETADKVHLAPNPARDVVYIGFNAGQEAVAWLQLLDMKGRIVQETPVPVVKGNNRIALRPDTPLSGLFLLKMNGVVVGKICFGG
jgi:hypothetical protein